MNATVAGLGADLNVANSIPVAAHDYDVTLNFDGQKLDGRLAALVDSDGALVDSWMGITRLSSATVTGTLHCKGGEDGECRIDAIVNGGLTTDSASEHLTLSGHERDSLAGDLGVKGSSATRREYDVVAAWSVWEVPQKDIDAIEQVHWAVAVPIVRLQQRSVVENGLSVGGVLNPVVGIGCNINGVADSYPFSS